MNEFIIFKFIIFLKDKIILKLNQLEIFVADNLS